LLLAADSSRSSLTLSALRRAISRSFAPHKASIISLVLFQVKRDDSTACWAWVAAVNRTGNLSGAIFAMLAMEASMPYFERYPNRDFLQPFQLPRWRSWRCVSMTVTSFRDKNAYILCTASACAKSPQSVDSVRRVEYSRNTETSQSWTVQLSSLTVV
jgi:hypothetical protein